MVSSLEKRIYDLQSPNALLKGRVGDLQSKPRKLEELAAKYKRHWEKLKKEKEAREAKWKE